MPTRLLLFLLCITMSFTVVAQKRMNKKEMASLISFLESKRISDSLKLAEQAFQIDELNTLIKKQNQEISKLKKDLRLAREISTNLTLTEDALVQRLKIELEDLAYEHEVEIDSIHAEWEEKMAYNLAIMDSVYKHKLSLFLAINAADSSTVDITLSAFDSLNFTSPLDSSVIVESDDSTQVADSSQVTSNIARFEEIPDSLIGVFHLDSVRILCNDFQRLYYSQRTEQGNSLIKYTDYYDTAFSDAAESLTLEENQWFRSNKLVIEPKGLVRWLVKSVAIFEEIYQGKPITNHQDEVNICLDTEFPNYQPEDIEILQYSGTMLEWTKGFPLCGNNETSPFCLEWRFNAADKTAKIDIYMKGAIVKIFYSK